MSENNPYGNGPHEAIIVNGKKLVAVHIDKQTNGILEFKFDDGTVMDKSEVINYVKNGDSTGLTVGNNSFGEFVRSMPDGIKNNDLDDYPRY